MDKKEWEQIMQRARAYGLISGKCELCPNEGMLIAHENRLGGEHRLCESCSHRIWEHAKEVHNGT